MSTKKKKNTSKKKTAANSMSASVKAFLKGYGNAITGRTGTSKISK